MEVSALNPISSRWLFPRNPKPATDPQIRTKRCIGWRIQASMSVSGESSQKHTKIVTFLGKGGSGKTTASVLAAKLYAREGLQTCLITHSQDITVEQLMGSPIGNSPTMISENLYAVQLQSCKMLLEPLDRMKKVDARMNLTQGILEGVVGEELGVLPGMDSIFSFLALQKYGNFLPSGRNYSKKEFDIVIYDGNSSEDTLRLVGATKRVRWYLKYIRNLAEKTDIGRLTAPSFLRLVYESARPNPGPVEGKTSTDIWNEIEQILEEASANFCDSSRFRCYLLMDPSRPLSVISALRYWGCAIQAGTKIYGAFGFAPKFSSSTQETMEKLSPLCFALLPYISCYSSLDWDITLNSFSKDANHLLLGSNISLHSSVLFDHKQKSVTLFLPGFNKSEIKLYQVLSIVNERRGIQKISFVAHSLGGLITRYAIGRLYESSNKFSPPVTTNDLKEDGNWEGTIAGLEAMNFITFASPHLGSRGHKQLPLLCGLPFLEQRASEAAHLIAGRTGNHLFLTDDDGRPPLLLRMVDDGEDIKFMSALRSFKRRVVYANANYDHMVGWRTSSIRRQQELPKYHLLMKDERYPHIVHVDKGNNKNTFEEASSDVLAQKYDLEEGMIQGLTQVLWEHVDVSF